VSALSLSMTSFQELALLASEAWLEAGDPRRAMPYARDLVDAPTIDEGLKLKAQTLLQRAESIGHNGGRLVSGVVHATDVKELQSLGDAVREQLGSGVGVLAASFEDGKNTLLVVVTDDLRESGLRADSLIKDMAAAAGGRGGGKAHMAQAGIPDASRLTDALARAPEIVRGALSNPS